MTTDKREEKFKNLAEKRTVNAIKQIRLLGNLSNRGNYSYDKKDVDKIFSAILKELKSMREKFNSNEGKAAGIFKL
ncbi:MAG: hypothetical protein ACN6I3_00440 [bacterium]